MMAGLASFNGLMPDDAITTSSWSFNMRLYTNKTVANREIGANMVNMRGIKSDVNLMNIPADMPFETIKSKKRNDCESQIIDINEKQTIKKPMNICLKMYVSSFFIFYMIIFLTIKLQAKWASF